LQAQEKCRPWPSKASRKVSAKAYKGLCTFPLLLQLSCKYCCREPSQKMGRERWETVCCTSRFSKQNLSMCKWEFLRNIIALVNVKHLGKNLLLPGQINKESIIANASKRRLKAVLLISGIDRTQIESKFPIWESILNSNQKSNLLFLICKIKLKRQWILFMP